MDTQPKQRTHPFAYRASRSATGTLLGLLLLGGVLPISVSAATGAISQSYQTSSSNVSRGALLSLTSKGTTTVVPADSMAAPHLVGVATSKPLVELSSGNAGPSTVQVVVSGSTEVLVSDLNGPVKAGDKITASPIAGLGMKALSASEVVGVAQADLDSVKTVAKDYAGTHGGNVSAKVGLLPVAINVTYYSGVPSGSDVSAFVPMFLQKIANSVAGKAVSPLRVLLGAAVLLIGFTMIIIMLYVGIKSEVISIGRNPLASDVLRGGLLDILITAVGLVIVTGVIVAAVVIV